MSEKKTRSAREVGVGYDRLLGDVSALLEHARRASARAVNAVLTATYWEIGRHIVEFEQGGQARAEYGERVLKRLSSDLTARFGRGFSERNLQLVRLFHLAWPISQTVSARLAHEGSGSAEISQTPSAKSLSDVTEPTCEKSSTPSRDSDSAVGPTAFLQTPSGESRLKALAGRFPLPWSAYVRLLSVKNEKARAFYEAEALRGGWSVRQLDRQIATQFYERTALSRDKAAMLEKGSMPKPADEVTPEEAIKDPYVLEFLGLKDEYSESILEDALIRHLESFLLELGNDFAFIARQKRLRIGDEWYRIDLLFFHRRLRCLVVIDLKVDKFTHADAGQMHMYLNYAAEHWTNAGENPPVGLILCAEKNAAVAEYALQGLPNKVLASEYRMALPDEGELARELAETRRLLEARTRPHDSEDT